jgi:uncharacterized membrane protein
MLTQELDQPTAETNRSPKELVSHQAASSSNGERNGHTTNLTRLAAGLGWFSIGLGLAELLAPRQVARLIGAKGHGRTYTTLRALGLREVVSGVGILSRADEPNWLWSRLGGDIVDMALLTTKLRSSKSQRARGVAATAVVLGVAAVDGLTALELSREKSLANGHFTHPLNVTAAITINRAPDEVYRFWHNLENLPGVLSHLESVRVEADRSHWRAKLPPGLSLEWSAQIDEDIPNEVISWRSLPGGLLQNHGRVRFKPAPGGRGTELHVVLGFEPLGGPVGAAFVKLLGSLPAVQLRADLKRLKQVMETGSVMRSDASVHSGPHPARPAGERKPKGMRGEAGK